MDGKNDPKADAEVKRLADNFFTSLSESDKTAAKASKINDKVKLILQIVADCDQLVGKGQYQRALKGYIECAEALQKMDAETKDDTEFNNSLKQTKARIVFKAE